jgi:hypothetical protein
MMNSIDRQARVLGISIRYGPGEASCWRCLSGRVDTVNVRVTETSAGDIENSADWLLRSWREKDRWLCASENMTAIDPDLIPCRITDQRHLMSEKDL